MDRFFSKTKEDKETKCLVWVGVTNGMMGYGQFWLDGKMRYAHRVSYELKHGVIPNGFQVLHRCNNPPCVNVEHLYLGNQSENMLQCHADGRGNTHLSRRVGELNGQSKLAEQDILLIRKSLLSHRKIAKYFGVSKSVVGDIKRGKRWTHVT